MNRKTKKTLKWVAIGLALGILTMITLVVLFFTLFLFGGPATRTTNIDKYSIIFEKRVQSGLIIFPEEIAANVQETEFSYYYKDTWDDPTVSIFLQCTYTSEDYEAEVQRLQSTKKDYGGTERVLLQEEGVNYPYPAYIAVENHHHQYEYALLSGENQITYIYTSFFWKDDIKFDQKYLPKDFMKEQEDTFYDGYSIYIMHIDTQFGGISYDTTRDTHVVVTDAHGIWIEDSRFTVRVQFDEQDREIITECLFSYYEPAADLDNVYIQDTESDDTIFTDLAGYEYKDVRLNEERTTAIVTYLDNGEEKEWEMELTQYMK